MGALQDAAHGTGAYANGGPGGNGPGGALSDEELRKKTSDLGIATDLKVDTRGRGNVSYARQAAQESREAKGLGETPHTTVKSGSSGGGNSSDAISNYISNAASSIASTLGNKMGEVANTINKGIDLTAKTAAASQPLTWDTVDDALQKSRDEFNSFLDTYQNTFGVTTQEESGLQKVGPMVYGNGLEDWKDYGTELETTLKARNDALRAFMEEHAEELDMKQAAALREDLDRMDEAVSTLWRGIYDSPEMQAFEKERQALLKLQEEGEKLQSQQELYNAKQEKIESARKNLNSITGELELIDIKLSSGNLSDAERTQLQTRKEELLREKQNARTDVEEAEKANDWKGRQGLIDRYTNLQGEWVRLMQSGNIVDVSQAERIGLEMQNIQNQLREGDKAAGNGERSYTGRDRAANVAVGTAGGIASSLLNAGVTAADATARERAYGQEALMWDQMADQNRALMEQMNAQNPDFATLSIPEAPTAEEKQAERIAAYESEDRQARWNKLYKAADSISAAAQHDLEVAKEGLSELGQAGVDIAQNILEMGFDAGVTALTGGGALPSMFLRTFGSAAQEARLAGADLDKQMGYGSAKAWIEVGTEMLFDGVAKIYGKGAADDIVESLVGKLAESDTGRTLLRVLAGAGGEGVEEVISSLLSPLAEAIYKDDSIGELYRSLEPSEILYDFLIGSVIGLMGGGTSIATGQNAAANFQLLLNDAGLGDVNNQTNAAMDVLFGKQSSEAQNASQAAARARLAQKMGGEDALTRYLSSQKLSGYDNVTQNQPTTAYKDDAPQKIVRWIAENGRLNNTQANEILNDPVLRAGAERYFNISFEGMTTYEARNALQNAARQTRYLNNQFREQESNRAAAEQAQRAEAEAQAQAEAQAAAEAEAARIAEEQRPKLNQTQTTARDILLKHAQGDKSVRLRDILTRPELRQAFAELYPDVQLDSRSDVAWRQLQDIARELRTKGTTPLEDTFAQQNSMPTREDLERRQAEIQTRLLEIMQEEQSNPFMSDEQAEALAEEEDALNEEREEILDRIDNGDYRDSAPVTPPVTETASTPAETPEATTAQPQELKTEQSGEVTEKLPPVNENGTPKEVPSQSHSIEGQMAAYGQDYEAPTHISKPEIESLTNAMNRADSNMNGEMQKLMGKEAWTGEDIDTAMVINGKLLVDAIKNNDFSAVDAWLKVVEPHKSEAGRALQALSKWARGGRAVVADTQTRLAENKTLDAAEKSAVMNKVLQFADRFDMLEDGDLEGVRKLILDMNKERNTGTFFPGLFNKFLESETDFNYLKEYAMRQLMSVPNDSLVKTDLGKKLKTWQSLAQLMRITTTLRNVLGNESFGILDFIPQNTVGTWLDALISAVDGTGIRTVGMSSSWLDSDARKAMGKAIERSMMEIAGDVYMGGSNAYGTQGVRTFKASDANVMNRLLSRAEQLSGYALQTTDEAASARQMTAYMNMLERLNGEKLSDQQKEELARAITEYRLFKNNGRFKKFSQLIHDSLNGLAGVGGEMQGGQRKGGFGLAEVVGLSYPGVPANLGAKPLEYSPANVAKGTIELIKYFSDANKTGEHNLALRQQAVMDAARGVTGSLLITAITGLFKSGILKYYDDEDDYDVMQQNRAEGKAGTLINLSAFDRMLDGESTEWQTDSDRVMSIGYLQPVNSLMAVAHFLNKDSDDGLTAEEWAKDFGKGSWNGLLDMPVMQSIAQLADVIDTDYDVETGGSKLVDSLVTIGGNAVTGMIPGLVSQSAKAMDTVDRDTSGDTALERVVNAGKKAIPGLRETLPEKIDSFGNPVTLDENTYDRVMNALVRPGTIGNLKQSEASQIVADVIEQSGDKKIMPDSRAPATVKVDGEPHNLSAAEKRAYRQEFGNLYTDLITETANNETFKNATPEQQAAILAELESYAKDRAKASVAEKNGGAYESKYQTLLDGTYDSDGDEKRPALKEKNLGEYIVYDTMAKSAYESGDYAAFAKELSNFENLDENTQKVIAAKSGKVGYYSGLLMKTDKSGNAYDIPDLKPQNLEEMIRFHEGLTTAVSNRDYNAIDEYVKGYADLDPNTQAVETGKAKVNSSLPLKNLLELSSLGVGSESWYEWKRAQNEAQEELDRNANSSGDVKMLGLANANIPEEEKAIMLESEALDIGVNARAPYAVLKNYGYTVADAYDWYVSTNASKNKDGEWIVDAYLSPVEVANAIQNMDNVPKDQKAALFKAFSDYIDPNHKNSSWQNDRTGKPYTYKEETNYIYRYKIQSGKAAMEADQKKNQ